jgi:hypothetical protein
MTPPMNWEIFIQDLPAVATANDIPADFRPRPIGDREAIAGHIMQALPMAQRQDHNWFFAQAPGIDLSIELHMEDAAQVRYMVARSHGGDQDAVAIAALLRVLGLRAMDTSTGELFDCYTLEEGL